MRTIDAPARAPHPAPRRRPVPRLPPAAYLGRTLSIATPDGEWSGVLDGENIAEAMFWAVDLMINNSRWTGIPEHCRFVFSVEEAAFEEGLRRIRVFWDLVAG